MIQLGTICHAADALAEAGAVEVYASCTHPVLSGPAMDNIQKSAIKKLVVLDTIYLPEDRLIDKIEQISIAKLLAEAIVRIHENRPLSPYLKSEMPKMLTIRRLGNWPLLFREDIQMEIRKWLENLKRKETEKTGSSS